MFYFNKIVSRYTPIFCYTCKYLTDLVQNHFSGHKNSSSFSPLLNGIGVNSTRPAPCPSSTQKEVKSRG